jgi:hypothetical protein
MHVGEKYKLYIPSELAYGAQSPSPAIPANSVLVFDLELLGIKDPAKKTLPSNQRRSNNNASLMRGVVASGGGAGKQSEQMHDCSHRHCRSGVNLARSPSQ